MNLPDEFKFREMEYDEMSNGLYGIMPNGDKQKIADIRGWGFLTGGASHALSQSKAMAIQKAWGNKIVKVWNDSLKAEA